MSPVSDPANTNNRVFDDYGTIGGGADNRVGSDDADTTTDRFATIAGGSQNRAAANSATIGGGFNNQATGNSSAIFAGGSNVASGQATFIGGGTVNEAGADFATVGGGNQNQATGEYSTVGGGSQNQATGSHSSALGGASNVASGSWSTVLGGQNNAASADHAAIAGGAENQANGLYSFVGGGLDNIAYSFSSVAGGLSNHASGTFAFVPGGEQNVAGGAWSFAGGRRAKIRDAAMVGGGDIDGDEGTFIWADSTDPDFISTGPNQFLIRASGGVGIGTNFPLGTVHITDDRGSVHIETEDNVNGSILVLQNNTNLTDVTLGSVTFVDSAGQFPGQISYNDNELVDDLTFRVGSSERMRITGAGTVEIGTMAASSAMGLKVEAGSDLGLISGGFMQLGDAGGANMAFDQNEIMARNNGSGATLFINPSEGDVLIGNNNANVRVGIGTNTPAQALTVDGSVQASCGILTCSDARFKQNIAAIDNALKIVTALQGVTFEWRRKAYPDRKWQDKHQVGFIAQKVEKIAPQVVSKGADGYYAVDYGRLTPILVEAIKEQQAEIEEQHAEMNAQHKLIVEQAAALADTNARLQRLERVLESMILTGSTASGSGD